MIQGTEHLPWLAIFGKPKAIEQGRKRRKTATIAKQQLHFKGETMAEYDVFGQRDAQDEEVYIGC